jgi:hypothetical protein
MIVKDHEGKTSGSVLDGLVYAYECALLVIFHIHDAKKNPCGRNGYPEKYWNPFFVSPKCGKRLGYTRYRIHVQGLEFEVCRVSAQAVNWYSDPSKEPGLLTKIPLRDKTI